MRHANASLAFGLAAFGSLAVAGPALAQAPASGPGSSRQAIQHGVVRGSATPAGTPGTAPGMSAHQQEMVAATGRMTRDMMDAPMTATRTATSSQ